MSLLLALLLSQSQLSNSLPLAALSVPDLRPFPQHRNSMQALAARTRNRGKLGTRFRQLGSGEDLEFAIAQQPGTD